MGNSSSRCDQLDNLSIIIKGSKDFRKFIEYCRMFCTNVSGHFSEELLKMKKDVRGFPKEIQKGLHFRPAPTNHGMLITSLFKASLNLTSFARTLRNDFSQWRNPCIIIKLPSWT